MDKLTNLSLFSGVAGLDLGAHLTGKVRTVCYVEQNPYAQQVLLSRMRDGGLEPALIWDDVTTFDARFWRGRVDIISGGFPCQDVSFAGKGCGLEAGERSGLWRHFARIIREARPRYVLVENVPGLVRRGLAHVLKDLAEMGYDATWRCVSAAQVGARHKRERIWIVAYPQCKPVELRRGPSAVHGATGRDEQAREVDASWRPLGRSSEDVADAAGEFGQRDVRPWHRRIGSSDHRQEGRDVPDTERRGSDGGSGDVRRHECQEEKRDALRQWIDNGSREEVHASGQWWETEPPVGRVVDGVAYRVDRLRCCGNGVVPQASLPAWEFLVSLAP